MVIEVTGERLAQGRDLASHPGPGHLGQHEGVSFTGDQGGHHLKSGDSEDVRGDHRELDAASSSNFSTRFFSAVPDLDQIDPLCQCRVMPSGLMESPDWLVSAARSSA